MPEYKLTARLIKPVTFTVTAPTLEEAWDYAEFRILNESEFCEWGDPEVEFDDA